MRLKCLGLFLSGDFDRRHWASCAGRFGLRAQAKGNLLDVLCGGGGEQALAGDLGEASEARIAVTMQLFGVGEGALDGFLAAAVDGLAPCGQPVGIAEELEDFVVLAVADHAEPGEQRGDDGHAHRDPPVERVLGVVPAVFGVFEIDSIGRPWIEVFAVPSP